MQDAMSVPSHTTKSKNMDGMSLVLVMIVLGGVMLLGLAASQLVLRESGSVRGIEQSEIAYYAAEAGAERLLYAYNKPLPRKEAIPLVGVTCTDLEDNLETYPDASRIWPYYKQIDFQLLTQPSAGLNEWTVPIPVGATTFEIAMDLEGALYPANRIDISDAIGGQLTVVVVRQDKVPGSLTYGEEFQNVETGTNVSVPGPNPDHFDWDNYYYRIKVLLDGSGNNLVLTPNPASDVISVGFTLTTCGQYKNVSFERRLEAQHLKWAIY